MATITAPTTSGNSPKCFFLEIAAEIRILIYEKPAQLQSGSRCNGYVGFRSRNTPGPKTVAITQVNRQVRKESLTIIYRHMEFYVHLDTATSTARRKVEHWVQTANPAALASINSIRFYTIRHSACCVRIPDLQSPQLVADYDCCIAYRDRDHRERVCDVLSIYSRIAKEKVCQLDRIQNERRPMTKEMMEKVIGMICTLSGQIEADSRCAQGRRKTRPLEHQHPTKSHKPVQESSVEE